MKWSELIKLVYNTTTCAILACYVQCSDPDLNSKHLPGAGWHTFPISKTRIIWFSDLHCTVFDYLVGCINFISRFSFSVRHVGRDPYRPSRLGGLEGQDRQTWHQKLSSPGSNANSLDSSDPGQQRGHRGLHEQHLHQTCSVWRIPGWGSLILFL